MGQVQRTVHVPLGGDTERALGLPRQPASCQDIYVYWITIWPIYWIGCHAYILHNGPAGRYIIQIMMACIQSSPSHFPLSAPLAHHAQSLPQIMPLPRRACRACVCAECNQAPLLCTQTLRGVARQVSPHTHTGRAYIRHIHVCISSGEGKWARTSGGQRQRGGRREGQSEGRKNIPSERVLYVFALI